MPDEVTDTRIEFHRQEAPYSVHHGRVKQRGGEIPSLLIDRFRFDSFTEGQGAERAAPDAVRPTGSYNVLSSSGGGVGGAGRRLTSKRGLGSGGCRSPLQGGGGTAWRIMWRPITGNARNFSFNLGASIPAERVPYEGSSTTAWRAGRIGRGPSAFGWMEE